MFTLIKLAKAMSILEQLERLIQITQTEVFKTKSAIFCPWIPSSPIVCLFHTFCIAAHLKSSAFSRALLVGSLHELHESLSVALML